MNHKKIVVLGAGESGVGAAVLAKKKGYDIFVSEKGSIKGSYLEILKKYEIEYEEGQHDEARILSADVVIKSPGIPDKVPLIKKLDKQGTPVIDEIEFGFQHCKAKIIAITGSNGKTTTTNLTYHLFKTAGWNVGLGGNVGVSFARQIAEEKFDYYVLEISSFQLDRITTFRPDVAILLNITPDHLDRYEYQFENYVNSKFNIIKNQDRNDDFIYNGSDITIKNYIEKSNVAPHWHCIFQVQSQDISYYETSDMEHHRSEVPPSPPTIFYTNKMSIKGMHNVFNATCAVYAAKCFGLPDEVIQKGLDTFVNDPHRMEKVAVINEITYINDSKATNVDSVFYALDAMTQPVIWIAGGTDKGNDYEPLMKLVREKVKAVICLGLDNQKILEAFSSQVKIIEESGSAEEAVNLAKLYAKKGDVVLLSPACASFDLFKNYKDRGNQFKAAVIKNVK